MVTFIPAISGEYNIRAVITDSSLPDPNPANNQFIWILSDQTTRKIFLPLCVAK
jgi:hypothetical protein